MVQFSNGYNNSKTEQSVCFSGMVGTSLDYFIYERVKLYYIKWSKWEIWFSVHFSNGKRPFKNWTEIVTGKCPVENPTIQFSNCHCITRIKSNCGQNFNYIKNIQTQPDNLVHNTYVFKKLILNAQHLTLLVFQQLKTCPHVKLSGFQMGRPTIHIQETNCVWKPRC
jgi:hypothetical protein